MAVQSASVEPYAVTECYGYDDAYWSQLQALSLPQQYLVGEHVAAIHTDIMRCLFAAMQKRLSAYVSANPRLTTLAKLLCGDTSEIVVIRERFALVLYRVEGRVIVGGVKWHVVH